MNTWFLLIVPSSVFGIFCGFVLRIPKAIWIAAAVPWFGVLIALIYTVYFSGQQATDSTMWPIAQFFGGGVAAVVGACSFLGARWFRRGETS